ncbi:permease [Caldisalinibacter kiritimatiensis]|uniref:Transporter n=1 Tax=Caldisalinibacter kiritimatiensis TaxID=1304284 RepID=R1CUE3_9FIRM|nr:permease [Caldisalinibacter kiritimatiensis]EOD00294.1 Transporter [Caldisalinibacter kiritimatiensis]
MLKFITEIFKFTWLYNLVKMLVENVFNISIDTQLGSSLHFFIYDTVKIIILLGIMIFIISYIRSYFSPEKTKKTLEKFSGITGNIMASLLGIVTPFCSCSSVPLFIGFVEAGIPIGVTFSFLITSPIVNEAAVAILIGTFGWKIAVVYVITGVIVGVVGGVVIDKLHLEEQVEEYVYQMKVGDSEIKELTRKERIKFAVENVKEIVGRVWKFILIGIGIGALIHGWAPAPILAKYAGPNNPLAVFVATIVAIPLYSNALGTIPIAEALILKGVGIGTAMAFMMATTALSVPEMILLRKVIKPKLIAVFVAITGIGIVLVGYLFNGIAHLLI